MRKPLEREKGRYVNNLDQLDDYAVEITKKICEMYPNIDVIDLRFCFETKLAYQFSLRLMESSLCDEDER